jgi:hypothetical protein
MLLTSCYSSCDAREGRTDQTKAQAKACVLLSDF